jgi:flagellar basal body-associated protein FliL
MSVLKVILIIVGVVLILVSIGPLIFGGVAAATYFASQDTMEENKKTRDEAEELGMDTSEMDRQIEQDEETMKTKQMFMGICLPTGGILLILGIVLIIVGIVKGKKKQPAPPPQPPPQQVPPGQWGQPSQDPHAQYGQPSQDPHAQYGQPSRDPHAQYGQPSQQPHSQWDQPSQPTQQWGYNQGPPRQGY